MVQSITLQTSDSDIVSGDILGRLSFAASSETSGSDALLIGGGIYAEAEDTFTQIANATSLIFSTANSETAIGKLKINSSGYFLPLLNNTYDIGSSSFVFRNLYVNSGIFTNLSVSGINVSLVGHTHSSSDITNFNSAVSGLLPVKNISAGNNITISSSSGIYTINSTATGGTSSSPVGVRGLINTTGILSSFSVPEGYPVGYLDVFQDGVKLASSLDFTATDGSSVVLSNSVPSGTVIEYLTMASGVSASTSTTDSRWDFFKPPQPTGIITSAGNTQVLLSWSAPVVLSQTPITDYIIQYSTNSGSTWTTFSDSVSTATSVIVTGLVNNTPYIFRVAAVNGIGQGSYSQASSSVTPNPIISVSYLLVGGGGGGGSERGAGGGAGGYVYNTQTLVAGTAISITVGSGGSGGNTSSGTSGENTTLSQSSTVITALGGGYGARGLTGLFGLGATNGGSGGSGGGGSGYSPSGSGGSGTSSQGYAGGNGYTGGEPFNGGGGGGAGGVGGSGQTASGGIGINTEASILTATSAGVSINGSVYIAGGGAAGSYQYTPGSGGFGGGGDGGNTNVAGTAGMVNTGGGGGGGGNGSAGGNGGSGIAIIRVADSVTAVSTTGSPSVYTSQGYRYYKFTTSGSITF